MNSGNIDLGVKIAGIESTDNVGRDRPDENHSVSESETVPWETDDMHHEQIRLGFWGVFVCTLHIVNGLFMAYLTYVTIFVYDPGKWSDLFIIFPLAAVLQLSSYTGILLRKNWARKIVMVLSWIQLIIIPVGTFTGLVMLLKLKGKQF